MADVIALLGIAIETVKKLRQVSEKIKDADTRNLIADLSNALADVKIEIAALKEENLRLAGELKKQASVQDDRNNMEVRDGVLYYKEAPQGKPQGPYCPNCREINGKMVLIQNLGGGMLRRFGSFHCPVCKSSF